MKTNAFNHKIPAIKDLFKDSTVEQQIRAMLRDVLDHLEIDNPEEVIDFTIIQAMMPQTVADYERKVHDLFDKRRITQRIPEKLSNRAKLIFGQILDYITGHEILDLGCGDGKVGELIQKQGRQVILADVYEHGNIANTGLPFVKIKQNKKISLDDSIFDTTLLITVLHHADDPARVISEAKRVTKEGGRIIVIESVYGVDEYGHISTEQQRRVNIFFDHFYNRVIHYSEHDENKVNVPLNFQTPESWKTFFEAHGLIQEKIILLGFDQATVPEYHTLHVLKVRK